MFISNPQQALPGNVMPFSGVADVKQRADPDRLCSDRSLALCQNEYSKRTCNTQALATNGSVFGFLTYWRSGCTVRCFDRGAT